jgi:hypothetical protein
MRETGKAGLANADITLLTADRITGQGIVERLTEYNIRSVDTFGPISVVAKWGSIWGTLA